MTESSLVLSNETAFDDNGSCHDISPYGEPFLFSQEGSYDYSYYLTYEEVDNLDYPSLSWYTNGSSDQDYDPGTWLGDYKFYFEGFWGEDEVFGDGGRETYGSSLDKDEGIYGGEKYEPFFSDNAHKESGCSDNQWPSYVCLDFGGDGMEYFHDSETQDNDPLYNSSWDDMEEMNLYESIFGHWSSPMSAA